MNLNEHCLLNFLINPDEISELTDVFLENIQSVKEKDIEFSV